MDPYRARLEADQREIQRVGLVVASQRGNALAQVVRELRLSGAERGNQGRKGPRRRRPRSRPLTRIPE